MSVSVSMPQLGESVTEGTVTRWLKKEGERVEVDEPLLEVSTDKVDTEIPSPASGILRGIAVDEDETVAVGAQLAVIEDSESGDAAPASDDSASAEAAQPEASQAESSQPEAAQPEAPEPERVPAASADGWSSQPNYAPPAPSSGSASPGFSGSSGPSAPAYAPPPTYAPPPAYGQPQPSAPYASSAPAYGQPAPSAPYGQPAPAAPAAPAGQVPAQGQPAPAESAPSGSSASTDGQTEAEEYPPPTPLPTGADAPYVTPLVRKLAAEHAVNLETISGTGVGGRIRKQDVIEAARAQRAAQPQAVPPQAGQPGGRAASAGPAAAAGPAGDPCDAAAGPAPSRGAVLAARHHPADVPAAPGHRPADG